MLAAKQHDPDDEPIENEVDALDEDLNEEMLDDFSKDEEAFESNEDLKGLVHQLYFSDEDDEDDDL